MKHRHDDALARVLYHAVVAHRFGVKYATAEKNYPFPSPSPPQWLALADMAHEVVAVSLESAMEVLK